MKYEFHVIQSFAPANLNRDDLGLPKECTFGGVRRARVSSQSWKRAVREAFGRETEGFETGVRTKRAHEEIVSRQLAADPTLDPAVARHRAAVVLEADPFGLSLKQPDEQDPTVKTGQLLFFRAHDLDTLASVTANFADELDGLSSSITVGDDGKKGKKAKLSKEASAAVRAAMITPSAAIDVALFGRMVAELPESNVDASCQVAHAIGTHRLESEDDFYTAVDDLRPEDTEGADMIGTVAYNSSCLYRYAVVDAEQLAANLGVDNDDSLVGRVLGAFARAFATSIPTGKQNTFAAQNPPTAVLSVQRASGAWNLANAFVDPVDARGAEGGVDAVSTARLVEQFGVLNGQFGRASDEISAVLLTSKPVVLPTGVAKVETLDALVVSVGGTA